MTKPAWPEGRHYTREEIEAALEEIWNDPDYEPHYALYQEILAALKAQREH